MTPIRDAYLAALPPHLRPPSESLDRIGEVLSSDARVLARSEAVLELLDEVWTLVARFRTEALDRDVIRVPEVLDLVRDRRERLASIGSAVRAAQDAETAP